MTFRSEKFVVSPGISMRRSDLVVLGGYRPSSLIPPASPSWLCSSRPVLLPLPSTLPAHGGDPAVLIHRLFSQKIREMIKGFQRKPRAWGEDEWELIEAAYFGGWGGCACMSPAPLSSATEPQIFLCRVLSLHPAQSKAGCQPIANTGACGRASGCAAALEERATAAGAD